MQFRATTPEELPQIAAFLERIYAIASDDPLLNSRLMAWRYYSTHPLWPESRSYILEKPGGGIAAHIAAVPGLMRTSAGPRRCLHFIDWAADPAAMMAGASALRKLMRLFDWTICVGGSADNQRLLPLLGFRASSAVTVWAKPLRPILQAATHQSRDWRLPARLIRNSWWSLGGVRPGSWMAIPGTPEQVPEFLWEPAAGAGAVRVRSAALMQYFLDCPAGTFRFWLLLDHGRPAGAALVNSVARQARICDIWLAATSSSSAAGALSALVAALRAQGGDAEAVLWGSTAEWTAAARACGFAPAGRRPVMVCPEDVLHCGPLELSMLADDAAYLGGGRPGYLT